MPSTSQIICSFYDRVSDSQIQSGILVFKRRLNHFARLLPGKKIIDAGCGPGHDTDYFARQGYDCLGIDFSRNMLIYARRHFAGRFQKKDLSMLNLKRDSIDGIWCSAVLMYFPQARRAKLLKSWHRFLRPAGILGLIIPKKTRRRQKNGQRLLPVYDLARLREQLTTAGFSILYEEKFICWKKRWWFVLARK